MNPCEPTADFRSFGIAATAELLDSAAEAVLLALESPDAEAVHKLRVSIRRFQQGLRLFAQFLRKKGVKAVRRELKSILQPAGELRNCDIAIDLLRRTEADTAELVRNRQQARTALLQILLKVGEARPGPHWRKLLALRTV